MKLNVFIIRRNCEICIRDWSDFLWICFDLFWLCEYIFGMYRSDWMIDMGVLVVVVLDVYINRGLVR